LNKKSQITNSMHKNKVIPIAVEEEDLTDEGKHLNTVRVKSPQFEKKKERHPLKFKSKKIEDKIKENNIINDKLMINNT